jgi:NADH dehydrogenase FAD-containing subunit
MPAVAGANASRRRAKIRDTPATGSVTARKEKDCSPARPVTFRHPGVSWAAGAESVEVGMRSPQSTANIGTYDVAVLGAGYAGLMAALRLGRKKWRLRVALVSGRDAFQERVRLQETVAATVAPRIPSISALVAGTTIEFIRGNVISLDAERRCIQIMADGDECEIGFDQAIYALGSTIDVGDVPGVAAHAYRLEAGDGPRSAAALRARLLENGDRPLRVVTVGGAETGVEVAGEIKTAWPRAEVIMLSRSRCGDFNGPRVEQAVRAELAGLGVSLIDGSVVTEVRANEVVTAGGGSIDCDICVWSGGLRSPALGRAAGLATDPQERIWVDADLRSISHPHVLAVGDAAHPAAPTGAPYRMSAFAALTSGAYAADAIVTQRAKRRLPPFSFSTFGQGVAIGRGGVGFFSYPDDRQRLFILKGRTARHVRNFSVWLLACMLKIERRVPGLFVWPGRRRVSWQQANNALQKIRAARKAQTA